MKRPSNKAPKTTKNDVMEALAADCTRLERDLRDLQAHHSNYAEALERLMRDVLNEVTDDLAHPTSIACGRLLQAVNRASETIHARHPS